MNFHYGQSHARRKSEDRFMPEKKTIERARKDARAGKASTTQAGKKCTISGRASTAHATPNRRLRLVYRKPGGPV
jgi:hypothetical protein